jgi:2-dehydro-3-deoxygalactonokinase
VAIQAEWVAVDWGTTNLRAWGIGSGGEVVFARTSDQGMSRLKPDAYGAVLAGLLADHFAPTGPRIDTLICGMAGARQGWMEAPYLDAPADLAELSARSVSPATPDARWSAHPAGVASASPAPRTSCAARTQLLWPRTLWPGFMVSLHAGHPFEMVQLAGRRVQRFATAMTGEVRSLAHSPVPRHSRPGRCTADCDAGCGARRRNCLRDVGHVVQGACNPLPSGAPDWCAGFLSGLLIGSETGAQRE